MRSALDDLQHSSNFGDGFPIWISDLKFLHNLELSDGCLMRSNKLVLSTIFIVVTLDEKRRVNVVVTELSKVQDEWLPHWVLVVPSKKI